MILNQQLIQDMFQQENSKDLVSLPREDVSLNFTVSSRSSKNQKKEQKLQVKQEFRYQSAEIIDMAAHQLSKFNQWVTEAESNFFIRSLHFDNLIEEIEKAEQQTATPDDLLIIKDELFKREQEDHFRSKCQDCTTKDKQIQSLEQLNKDQDDIIIEKVKQIGELKQQIINQAVLETKEFLVYEVQKNILKSEIRQLNCEINTLKTQKITLERTFLFNKTRTELINLQKSRDLSAAKNSTNSSQINRNHQSIVFIDPIESDVEEWIKFFEIQKNRYQLLCKKESDEKQKVLKRNFTKQEKQSFQAKDRICILFNSIKQILSNLTKIRQNTRHFEQVDNLGKVLKERMLRNSEQDFVNLRQELEKANSKCSKLLKINEYLVKQKRNLQEINQSLKQERLKENNDKNLLNELVRQQSVKVNQLTYKCKQYEEAAKQLKYCLIGKEQQLLYSFQEIKRLKKLNLKNPKMQQVKRSEESQEISVARKSISRKNV